MNKHPLSIDLAHPTKKILLAAVAAFILLTHEADAQANLTFSGGNGSPFSLTLLQSISFTITMAMEEDQGPSIVFDEVGDVLNGTGTSASGDIYYTINSGTAIPLIRIGSGYVSGDMTANDLYLLNGFAGTMPALNVGDIITLHAGTITTSGNVAAAPPLAGSYAAYVATYGGARISSFGAPVPEPGSIALAAMGGAAMIALRRARIRQPRR